MANHCIDIICTDCGYIYCGRCYNDGRITGEALEEKRRRKAKGGIKADEACPECGSKNTYID